MRGDCGLSNYIIKFLKITQLLKAAATKIRLRSLAAQGPKRSDPTFK